MGGSFEIVVVLRELEVTYVWGQADAEELMTAMSRLLQMRSEDSRLTSVRTTVVHSKGQPVALHYRNPYLFTVHKDDVGHTQLLIADNRGGERDAAEWRG